MIYCSHLFKSFQQFFSALEKSVKIGDNDNGNTTRKTAELSNGVKHHLVNLDHCWLLFDNLLFSNKNIPPDRKPRARFHFFSAEFGFRYSETVILKSQKQPKNGSTFGGFFL